LLEFGLSSGRRSEHGRVATCLKADDLYCTPFVEVRLPKGSWLKARVVPLGDLAYSQAAGGFGTKWGLIGA
jgi:hypothetical protein